MKIIISLDRSQAAAAPESGSGSDTNGFNPMYGTETGTSQNYYLSTHIFIFYLFNFLL